MIDLSHAKGQRYAVMGLAKSGLAAAGALRAGGANVLCWDDDPARRSAAAAHGLTLAPLNDILPRCAALILSPGIPHTHPEPHPLAAAAKQAGVPIRGDVALLREALPGHPMIGITGTNGKSTTTALIGHLLARAGRDVRVGGNLGTPVLSFPAPDADTVFVLEMSSYQIELAPEAGFDIAILLNITPDHLARHGGFEGYVAAKRGLFAGQTGRPRIAIISLDDAPCRETAAALAAEGAHEVIPISTETVPAGGVGLRDGVLVAALAGEQAIGPMADFPALPGRHNAQNAAAAAAAALALGLTPAGIATGLQEFPGLAHRQQLVGEAGGVRFINDSKATNAEAAARALESYEAIYWILGGRAKEGGLAGLEPLMGRVRAAFVIGECGAEFADWLEGRIEVARCGTLDRAVAAAAHAAPPGSVVLLSPAAASFDQFDNFEARGEAFAALVAARLAGAAQ